MSEPFLNVLKRPAVLKVHRRECAAELVEVPTTREIGTLDDVLELPEEMSLGLAIYVHSPRIRLASATILDLTLKAFVPYGTAA